MFRISRVFELNLRVRPRPRYQNIRLTEGSTVVPALGRWCQNPPREIVFCIFRVPHREISNSRYIGRIAAIRILKNPSLRTQDNKTKFVEIPPFPGQRDRIWFYACFCRLGFSYHGRASRRSRAIGLRKFSVITAITALSSAARTYAIVFGVPARRPPS